MDAFSAKHIQVVASDTIRKDKYGKKNFKEVRKDIISAVILNQG